MQQSSATQSLHLGFGGLRKIVACSHSSLQCLLVSTVFGMVSSHRLVSSIFTSLCLVVGICEKILYISCRALEYFHIKNVFPFSKFVWRLVCVC